MADQDILIAIRTALDSGGIDAAKSKLKDLTEATKSSSTAAADQNLKNVGLQQSINQTSKVLGGLNNATAGGVQGARGMLNAVEGLSASFPKLGAAVGAAGAVLGTAFMAWEVGLKIQKILWTKFIDGPLKDAPPLIRKSQAEFESLNNTKLDGLQKELQGILDNLNKAISAIDDAERRSGAVRSAKKEQEMSAAGMLEGSAATKANAEIEKKYAEEDLAAREEANKAKIAAAEKAKAEAGNLISAIDSSLADDSATFEEIKKRFQNRPGSAGLMNMLKESRNKDEANKVLRDASMKMKDQAGTADKTLADAKTEADVIGIEKSTVKSKYDANMSRASKEQKAEADKKAKEAAEMAKAAELAQIIQNKEEAQKTFDADMVTANASLHSSESRAKSSKSMADAYDPSKMNLRRNSDRKKAEATDREYDVKAATDENAVTAAKAQIEQLKQANKLLMAAINAQITTTRQTDKATFIT